MERYSPGGIYLGSGHALDADPDRTRRVLEKIMRGLVWHSDRHVMRQDVRVRLNYISAEQPPHPAGLEMARSVLYYSVVGGRVEYRFGVATDDPDAAFAALGFFGRLLFFVVTVPPYAEALLRGTESAGRGSSQGRG